MHNRKITIIGGGLAGSEAAFQLANRGWKVDLYEMRPGKLTPAHQTGLLAELVCSNSLKSELRTTASGLLKEELRVFNCELLKIAEQTRLPAGSALAVDRDLFAENVTKRIRQHPNISVHNREKTNLDDTLTIVASGPLSSECLVAGLQHLLGKDNLFFYDAIAPIIANESINRDVVYFKGRYDKGGADYLNCFLSDKDYDNFIQALLESEKYIGKEFEREYFKELSGSHKLNFYENCIPIEELARRGKDTLRFGVMRPVGLENPATGKRPYAVIQLRAENKEGTAFNLVGCQTMMTQASQSYVFRQIPGLDRAEFLRYGSIHRNTYLNAPTVLNNNLSLKNNKNIYIAGQLSGVEGYVESIASGLIVALIIAEALVELPDVSIMGQLWRRLTTGSGSKFIPVNANFGLLPSLGKRVREKKLRYNLMAERSLEAITDFVCVSK